jgi:DNA-binding protein H-NS
MRREAGVVCLPRYLQVLPYIEAPNPLAIFSQSTQLVPIKLRSNDIARVKWRKSTGLKQNAERNALRQRLVDVAKEHGFDIHDLFGKGRKGSVAVKYRDPKNPENTWTGRGRMPRWMAAATKGGKSKKEDFLI